MLMNRLFLVVVSLAISSLTCACQSGEAPDRPESQLLYLQQKKDGKWEVVIDTPNRLSKHIYTAVPSSIRFGIGEQKINTESSFSCPQGLKIAGTLEKEPKAGESILVFLAGDKKEALNKGITNADIAQAKQAKREDVFKHDDSTPFFFLVKLENPKGKTEGHILSIRLPMPKGLEWNSPEGIKKDEKKAKPQQEEWEKQQTLLVVQGRLYFSTYRGIFELGPTDLVEENGKKKLIDRPVEKYEVFFTIPDPLNLEDAELQFFDSFPTGAVKKLADLAGHKPDQVLKLTKERIEDQLRALRVSVRTYTGEFEGKEAFFADIRIMESFWGLAPSLAIKKVRLGTLEAVGELKDDFSGVIARFKEEPNGSEPAFIQIKGIPGWIKCER